MKKIFALLLSLTMLIFAASCDSESKPDSSNSDKASSEYTADEGLSALDVFDLYNEAVINFAEEEAYDTSIYVAVALNEDGGTQPVELRYQFRDTGDECEYYSYQNILNFMFNYVYYSDGVRHTVSKMGEEGEPVVLEEEIDYLTFMEETGNPAVALMAMEVTVETFESAEITEEDGTVTVKILMQDVTSMPDAMVTYATMLGFDPLTAQYAEYDDTEITIVITSDGSFKKIELKSGAEWVSEDGTEGMMKVDVDLDILATGDDVVVTKYEAAE